MEEWFASDTVWDPDHKESLDSSEAPCSHSRVLERAWKASSNFQRKFREREFKNPTTPKNCLIARKLNEKDSFSMYVRYSSHSCKYVNNGFGC